MALSLSLSSTAAVAACPTPSSLLSPSARLSSPVLRPSLHALRPSTLKSPPTTGLRSTSGPGTRVPGLMGIRGQFKDSEGRDLASKVSEDAQEATRRAAESLERGFRERQSEGILATSGTLGFTKRNELFVGRMAMLGFASAVIGEFLTGRGPLGQFNLETGIPVTQAPPLLLAFIGLTVIGAFVGGKGSQGYLEGDPAAAQKTRSIRGALGLAERGPLFGFTRPNEYFNGRLAQLGFALAILGEIKTGSGPIGQIHLETGIPTQFVAAALIFVIPLMLVASVNLGEGRFVNDRDVQ